MVSAWLSPICWGCSTGSTDAAIWRCFMLASHSKPQRPCSVAGLCVCVCVCACVCVSACCTKRTGPLVSNTTSLGNKRFLGNQLCKYWFMQMPHLNKSVCLGSRGSLARLYTWNHGRGRARERARQSERG